MTECEKSEVFREVSDTDEFVVVLPIIVDTTPMEVNGVCFC